MLAEPGVSPLRASAASSARWDRDGISQEGRCGAFSEIPCVRPVVSGRPVVGAVVTARGWAASLEYRGTRTSRGPEPRPRSKSLFLPHSGHSKWPPPNRATEAAWQLETTQQLAFAQPPREPGHWAPPESFPWLL